MKYRSDIDGLRAVAVLSVLFFHLDKAILPGGFIGVDVFLVISGFLITQLIHNEIEETQQFRFRAFYLRRIRRLFPAMLFTFGFCTFFCYQLFSPPHLAEYGQSLVSAMLSFSNVYFWNSTGYFDTQSIFKPLLHTWSLSIEEQFYLIWPALLLFLAFARRKWATPLAILLLGVLSLVLNVYFFSNEDKLSTILEQFQGELFLDIQSTVFYLLPFRVFEFAIGASLVWLNPLQKMTKKFNELIFALGLALILFSAFTFTETITFPSVNALIPCLGAAFVIFSGPDHRLIALLNNRFAVTTGLISYSLYLIHWPIIVFYTYWTDKITPFDQTVIVLLSCILAYFMYRFIEQPFRRIEGASIQLRNRRFVGSFLGLTLLVVFTGQNAHSSGGWLWRYPEAIVEQLSFKKEDYYDYVWKNILESKKQFDNNGKTRVLIVGDSMSADLLNAFVEGGGIDKLDVVAIPILENCKGIFPLTDKEYTLLYRGPKRATCKAEHDKVLNSPLLQEADTVILATYWYHDVYIPYIESTIKYLNSIGIPQVLLLGNKDQIPGGFKFLAKYGFTKQNHLIRTPPQYHFINKKLKNIDGDYTYINLMENFCNSDGCQRITESGHLIIFDGSHMTKAGATLVGRKLVESSWFKEMIQFR